MNTTKVVGVARSASQFTSQARYASTKTPRKIPKLPEYHGHQIWVYNNLLTNQVVYSLTKTLKNNHAINQLPYNGKKTVPRALRKDHWSPLATILFPDVPSTQKQGLLAFQKLREYRVMHETQWDPSLRQKARGIAEGTIHMTPEERKAVTKYERKNIEKKTRKVLGRLLCNQKANSIADMAVVLGKMDFIGKEQKETKEIVEVENKETAVDPEAGRVAPDDDPIVVQWQDVSNAEFAQSWPVGVVHDFMEEFAHAAPGFQPEEEEEEEEYEDEEEEQETESQKKK